MLTRISLTRLIVYGLGLFFPFWLLYLSSVFIMGYHTPLPRKLAITTVAIIVPILLWRERASFIPQILFVLCVLATWPLLILLWLEWAPDWIKYG
jgi:hypothetical protein